MDGKSDMRLGLDVTKDGASNELTAVSRMLAVGCTETTNSDAADIFVLSIYFIRKGQNTPFAKYVSS